MSEQTHPARLSYLFVLLIVALAGNASARGDEGRVLVWADRQGQMTPVIETWKDYHCSLALSPDDRYLAVEVAPTAAISLTPSARTTRIGISGHCRSTAPARRTIRWAHTFGLGGSSLVLWAALAFTGILMLLVYQPVPDVAYDSIQTLNTGVRFGPLVRGVHYWSANLLIVVVLLHIDLPPFVVPLPMLDRTPRPAAETEQNQTNWVVLPLVPGAGVEPA